MGGTFLTLPSESLVEDISNLRITLGQIFLIDCKEFDFYVQDPFYWHIEN